MGCFCGILKIMTAQEKRRGIVIGEGNLAGKGIYAARDFKKDEIIISYNLMMMFDQGD
jgi:hypothetical protein